MRRAALSIALLLLAAGCRSSSSGDGPSSGERIRRFPSPANVDTLWAEATFFTDHEEIFDRDLIDKEAILPIALRVGWRGQDTLNPRLTETFDAHLYLQDGTALDWLPIDSIRIGKDEVEDQVRRLSLDLSLLGSWETAQDGFIYFRVPEKNVAINGTLVTTFGGGVQRELDLLGSLLAFTVSTTQGDREVFVGLSSDTWPGR